LPKIAPGHELSSRGPSSWGTSSFVSHGGSISLSRYGQRSLQNNTYSRQINAIRLSTTFWPHLEYTERRALFVLDSYSTVQSRGHTCGCRRRRRRSHGKTCLRKRCSASQAFNDPNTNIYFVRAYISTAKSTTHACHPNTSDVFPMPLLPVETTTPPRPPSLAFPRRYMLSSCAAPGFRGMLEPCKFCSEHSNRCIG
jgi:hypothetical protein